MPSLPVPVPALSTPMPSTADRPNYGANGRALWSWEVSQLVPGMNALAAVTHSNALEAQESASTAAAVVGALMWNAATNYATGTAAISPTDMQTYRRRSPGGVNATDPASAPSLWAEVGEKRVAKAGDTGLGTMGFAAGAFIEADIMRFAPELKNCMFRTSFANSGTFVGARPNGTGTGSGFFATNATTSEFISMSMTSTAGRLEVGKAFSVFGDAYRDLEFRVGDAVRMTFVANGNIVTSAANMLMGASAFPANVPSGLYVANGISAGGFRSHAGTAGAFTADAWNLHWTGSAMQLWVGTTNVGNLTVTSDYRIKTDVRPMAPGALDRVAMLRPVVYRHADFEALNFTAEPDAQDREGFIAHELADVVPSAVMGEKDAPGQIQSLRLDPVVALLTQALQEMKARVEALEARALP